MYNLKVIALKNQVVSTEHKQTNEEIFYVIILLIIKLKYFVMLNTGEPISYLLKMEAIFI